MNKTILVLGATGQLGYEVVHLLYKKNYRIKALVRQTSDVSKLILLGVKLIYGDLEDKVKVENACSQVDAVIATASSIVPGDKDRFGERDVVWYSNIIQACQNQKVNRIVYISAFSSTQDQQVPEFQIKRQIESLIVNSGLKYTILRSSAFMDIYFSIMGSSLPLKAVENATLDRRFWFINLFRFLTRNLIEKYGFALVPGSGLIRHAFISIENVAQFMVNALEVNPSESLTCDICGPKETSWNEVVELYSKRLNHKIYAVHLPICMLQVVGKLLNIFSPGSGNIIATLILLGKEDYIHDIRKTADLFKVNLTSAQDFIENSGL